MLAIYGVYRSRASRNHWMALELGLPVTSVPVIQSRRVADPLADDAPLNTASPAYARINPMGLIPAMDDDGLILTQSLANNLHLARKHGGPLAAVDLGEEALFGNWTLWAATDVEPHAVKIVLAVDQGSAGGETIAASAQALGKPFAVLERHLAGRSYLVGERFTVADLNVAEVFRYAMSQTTLFEAHPNVAGWLGRCQARPAFHAMMAARAAEPA